MAPEKTLVVLEEVISERARQEVLKAAGKFLWVCSDIQLSTNRRMILPAEKLVVLAEEFGEVSREVMEIIIGVDKNLPITTLQERQKNLRKELIQVAAVAVAWAESL